MNVVFHHSNADLHKRVGGNDTDLMDDSTIDLDDVVLVANSGGLALLTGDSPQRAAIETLQERGVIFKQCRNTIAGTDTTEQDLIDGVGFVPSGVGELARL